MPRRLACALRYRPPQDSAPRLTATARGRLAERIIRVAEDAGVPVREDATLAELLSAIELMDEIPPELYQPVAVLLAAVYSAGAKLEPRQRHPVRL